MPPAAGPFPAAQHPCALLLPALRPRRQPPGPGRGALGLGVRSPAPGSALPPPPARPRPPAALPPFPKCVVFSASPPASPRRFLLAAPRRPPAGALPAPPCASRPASRRPAPGTHPLPHGGGGRCPAPGPAAGESEGRRERLPAEQARPGARRGGSSGCRGAGRREDGRRSGQCRRRRGCYRCCCHVSAPPATAPRPRPRRSSGPRLLLTS